jgi:hypothetical protein
MPKDPISEGIKYFSEHTLSSSASIDPEKTQKGLLNFCKRLNNIEREFIINALSNVKNPENNEIESKLIKKLRAPDTSALTSADSAKNKILNIWDKISGKKHITSQEVAQGLYVWAQRSTKEDKVEHVARNFSESMDLQLPPVHIEGFDEVNDLRRIMTKFNESSQSDSTLGWIKVANNEDKLLEKINTILPNLEKANYEGREVEGKANLKEEIRKLKDIQIELLNSKSKRVSPQQKIINQKNKIEASIGKLGEKRNYEIVGEKRKISLEIDTTIENAQELLTMVQDKNIIISDKEIKNIEEIIKLLNDYKQKVT